MASPLEMYCAEMEEVKRRGALVRALATGKTLLESEQVAYELIAAQLRKMLELLVFGSLTANREAYSKAHRAFRKHWNAKKLLENLRSVHPQFYPRPLYRVERPGVPLAFESVVEGFLTEAEFTDLYDRCGAVLHTRNPFRTDPNRLDFGHHPSEWLAKLEKLLDIHYLQFVESSDIWLVVMKDASDGKVHARLAIRGGPAT